MATPIQDAFLALLKDAVESAGSMNKLAHAAGIEQSLISRWLARTRVPTLDSVQQLLNYLGMEGRFAYPSEPGDEGRNCEKLRAALAERDRLINELQIKLAEARGEMRAMDRQLARMTPQPMPPVAATPQDGVEKTA